MQSQGRQGFNDRYYTPSADQRRYPSPPEEYWREKRKSGTSRSERGHQREAENLRNASPPLRVAGEIKERGTSRGKSRSHDAESPLPRREILPEREVTNKLTYIERLKIDYDRAKQNVDSAIREAKTIKVKLDMAIQEERGYVQDADRAAAKLREEEDVKTKQKMKRRITLENPDQACLDDEGVY